VLKDGEPGRVPGGHYHQRHQEKATDWREYCQLPRQPGQQHRHVAVVEMLSRNVVKSSVTDLNGTGTIPYHFHVDPHPAFFSGADPDPVIYVFICILSKRHHLSSSLSGFMCDDTGRIIVMQIQIGCTVHVNTHKWTEDRAVSSNWYPRYYTNFLIPVVTRDEYRYR
jgi:hypothetical protein